MPPLHSPARPEDQEQGVMRRASQFVAATLFLMGRDVLFLSIGYASFSFRSGS